MRLFTGLDLPEAVTGNLHELLRRLQPAARVSWSSPANWHITTKFIGEWHEDRLDELRSALATLPSRAEIPVAVRGLGFFPNARRPSNFWAGIEAPGLPELAAAIDVSAASLGIESEKRKYSPHLTLARVKASQMPLTALHAAIEKLPSTEWGSFTAGRFFLYQSALSPRGSVYTKLAEFPLTKP